MKRVFCSILAGLMMLSMFTGCSSSQNSSASADGEKTVVELWTVWKTDAETGSESSSGEKTRCGRKHPYQCADARKNRGGKSECWFCGEERRRCSCA